MYGHAVYTTYSNMYTLIKHVRACGYTGVYMYMSVYGHGLHSASLQTLEFIANMQEGEKVLIFTGRKTT